MATNHQFLLIAMLFATLVFCDERFYGTIKGAIGDNPTFNNKGIGLIDACIKQGGAQNQFIWHNTTLTSHSPFEGNISFRYLVIANAHNNSIMFYNSTTTQMLGGSTIGVILSGGPRYQFLLHCDPPYEVWFSSANPDNITANWTIEYSGTCANEISYSPETEIVLDMTNYEQFLFEWNPWAKIPKKNNLHFTVTPKSGVQTILEIFKAVSIIKSDGLEPPCPHHLPSNSSEIIFRKVFSIVDNLAPLVFPLTNVATDISESIYLYVERTTTIPNLNSSFVMSISNPEISGSNWLQILLITLGGIVGVILIIGIVYVLRFKSQCGGTYEFIN